MLNELKDSSIKKRISTQTECQQLIKHNITCPLSCSANTEYIFKNATECTECTPKECTLAKQVFVDDTNAAPASITHTNKVALIAGLISGLTLFISIVIVILVYYRKRKRQQLDSFKEETQAVNMPNVSNVHTSSSLSSKNENKTHIDYCHPNSPFVVGAYSLQIPHLDTQQTPVFSSDIVRRSLNIQHTVVPMNSVSRSSSVKITKFDYDTIQTKHPLNESRFNSPINKGNMTNTPMNSIGSIENTQLCANPAVAHLRRQTHETNIPTELSSALLTHSNTSGNIDFYFSPSNTHSQVSVQSSASLSTLGDGEITVYYDPTNNN